MQVESDNCDNCYSLMGTQMGKSEWDVKGRMQSRQDYIILGKKKKKRLVAREIAQEVRRHTEFAELQGKAFWFCNMSVTCADFCRFMR